MASRSASSSPAIAPSRRRTTDGVTGDLPFSPDSRFVAAVRPSPNHNERRGTGRPDAILLHYTGMVSGAAALARLCEPAAEVSAHYVVEEDGTVFQLVPEMHRAWHAGRGTWAGASDLNSASIGIEIVNGGHDFGLPPYPDQQIVSVIALCRDIIGRHGIAAHRILAHSDVAPTRKQDPGEHFPWSRLAASGIGLWVPPGDDPSPLDPEATLAVQHELARVGYALPQTGLWDEDTRRVVVAFQRRYRPSRIDGTLDAGTRDTLARLMALRFPADPAGPPGHA